MHPQKKKKKRDAWKSDPLDPLNVLKSCKRKKKQS